MSSGHDTLRRDGGWTVELISPLKTGEDVIDINPPSLDHIIRWGEGTIPSNLALLSELCGVTERKLRGLAHSDLERVMMAYAAVLPSSIREDFQNAKRPLATPIDQMQPEDRYEAADVGDRVDPRFPKFDAPVKKFTEPPPDGPSPPPMKMVEPGGSGIDMSMPQVMK